MGRRVKHSIYGLGTLVAEGYGDSVFVEFDKFYKGERKYVSKKLLSDVKLPRNIMFKKVR